MNNKVCCPLCSGNEVKQVLICTDDYISKEEFNILKCSSCGFTWTDNPPEEESIAKYYDSEEYISHSNTSKGLINSVYHFIRDIMLRRKLRLLKKIMNNDSATVLDIGSGAGTFPSFLKQQGWECRGLEISQQARKMASEVYNIELHEPSYINSVLEKSIDCITMWHTLEHFHNIDEYLTEAGRILKDKGYLVIALPNHDSFDAKHYKQFWAAWDVPRHLWHFTPLTITAYLRKFGFRIESMHRLPYDSFYVSALSEKYKGGKAGLVKGMIIGTFSWLTSLINKSKSSSLIYIFSKN